MSGYPRDPMLCPRCGNLDFLVLRNGTVICADEDCHAEYGQLASRRQANEQPIIID